MWAEGYTDFCEPIETYLAEFNDPPEWVEKSLRNQIDKHIGQDHGPK